MSTIRFIKDSQRFDLICRFVKDFVLSFQRASFIHYFTSGFFFDYNFNFYVSTIQIKYVSDRAFYHIFYVLFLFLCKHMV